MGYDKHLVNRVRNISVDIIALDEKVMFGGLVYFLNGHMCCAVFGTELVFRIGSENMDFFLQRPNARQADLTGSPMKGWIMVSEDACLEDEILAQWIKDCISFVHSLKPK